MHFEQFLFTRNSRQDFAVFVRPRDLSNTNIEIIKSAIGAVLDTSKLTSIWPALYCFSSENYTMLLRHYRSDRKHSGRPIPVLEGIAVKHEWDRHLALALPYIINFHSELLNISANIEDIDKQEIQMASDIEWSIAKVDKPYMRPSTHYQLVEDFTHSRHENTLIVTFDAQGRELLTTALLSVKNPLLSFAFGTTAETVRKLGGTDIVSYFSSSNSSLKPRSPVKTME